jgi:hypothetical protein
MNCSVLAFTTMLEMRPSGENVLNAAIVRAASLQGQDDPRPKFCATACEERALGLNVASATTNLHKHPACRRVFDPPRSASARWGISPTEDATMPRLQIGHDQGCTGSLISALDIAMVVGVFALFPLMGRHRTVAIDKARSGPPNSYLSCLNMLICRGKNCVYLLFIR